MANKMKSVYLVCTLGVPVAAYRSVAALHRNEKPKLSLWSLQHALRSHPCADISNLQTVQKLPLC